MPTSTQSIREMISTQPSAAAVLQRFGIDLRSHADESLADTCAELQLSVDQVCEKLSDAAVSEHGAAPADLASYSLVRLIQHIVRTHHHNVRRELPRLAEMAHTLAGKHDRRSPELKKVETLLGDLHAEMLAHLEREEQMLFPFIAQMEEGTIGRGSPGYSGFRAVSQPISMMIHEHEPVEELVAEMRALTNGFEPPSWACPTYIALYAAFKAFEKDLRQHVHLENDLLFPRALQMERKLVREK